MRRRAPRRAVVWILLATAATAAAATVRNLGFATSPQSVLVNTCSTVVQAQTQDYAYQPANAAANITVTPSGSFQFYSDAACTQSISSVVVAAGTSSASFYFKGLASGNQVMQLTGGGLNAGSQTETILASVLVCPPVGGGGGGNDLVVG